MTQVWRLIQTSNLISRTQSIFTMFSGRKCLQVKINLTNLYIMFSTWEARRLRRSPRSKFSCGPLDINSWVDPSWDATLNEPVAECLSVIGHKNIYHESIALLSWFSHTKEFFLQTRPFAVQTCLALAGELSSRRVFNFSVKISPRSLLYQFHCIHNWSLTREIRNSFKIPSCWACALVAWCIATLG